MEGHGGFEPRNYRPGDEAEILRLFREAFGHERSLAHWRWKYADDPWGAHKMALTFAPDGRLVAHYGGYPVPWEDARAEPVRDLLCLHIGDTMTQPGFRRIGRGDSSLLGRTIHHFVTQHCVGQVAVSYGFNTEHLQKFLHRFAHTRFVGAVPYWRLDLTAFAPRRRRLFEHYSAEPVPAATAEWSDFYTRVRRAYGSLARRDQAYVTWRYVDCPDRPARLWTVRSRGRLVGWAAFRRVGEELVWGDALFDPRHPGALDELLRATVADDRSGGAPAQRIAAWFAERPRWWPEWLHAAGLRRAPEPNRLGFICRPFLEPDADRGLLGEGYYTHGDSDLF